MRKVFSILFVASALSLAPVAALAQNAPHGHTPVDHSHTPIVHSHTPVANAGH
ncbi:MAG: hypothetical protein ABI142_10975 [Bryocella sp.]